MDQANMAANTFQHIHPVVSFRMDRVRGNSYRCIAVSYDSIPVGRGGCTDRCRANASVHNDPDCLVAVR